MFVKKNQQKDPIIDGIINELAFETFYHDVSHCNLFLIVIFYTATKKKKKYCDS